MSLAYYNVHKSLHYNQTVNITLFLKCWANVPSCLVLSRTGLKPLTSAIILCISSFTVIPSWMLQYNTINIKYWVLWIKINSTYLDFLFDSFRAFFQNLAYLVSTGRAPRKLDIINFIPSAPFKTPDFRLSNNNINNAYNGMIATNQYNSQYNIIIYICMY